MSLSLCAFDQPFSCGLKFITAFNPVPHAIKFQSWSTSKRPLTKSRHLPCTKHRPTPASIHVGDISNNADQLKRHLGNRQVQLIAIGGSIGTATFVSISSGLVKGGPGSLLLAYTIYSCMMGLVNNCIAEMATFMPVTGAFIRMAGKWVDESFGFLAGWNFYIYEVMLIPFEITALNLVLTFWRDDIPVAAVVAACIVLYL